ncbi:MAG: hypothetical protein RXO36_07370 [Candidatus Nanopusillus acidilobi]
MVADDKRVLTFMVWLYKDGKDYQGTIALYQEDGIVDYQVQWEQNPFNTDEEAQVWERYVLDTIKEMDDDCTRCLHFKGTKTTIRRHE